MNLTLTLGKRILLLACITTVCFLVISVLNYFLLLKFGADSTPAMRILAVLQDVILFITPVIITAVMVTRTPATLMAIDIKPSASMAIIAVCALITAIPLINYLAMLNDSISLPDSMNELENTMRSLENRARNSISVLQGAPTIGNLIMSLLIVAVFAGVSEEIFFRGGLQRLLTTGGVNPHVAIWGVAIFFSVLHFQFYGFIPRTLLGAYFGYLLWWSRSLWVPIIVHIANNAIYTVAQWHSNVTHTVNTADQIGTEGTHTVLLMSAALTAVCFMLLLSQKKRLDAISKV